MAKKTLLAGLIVVIAAAGAAYYKQDLWRPSGAVAQSPQPANIARAVPVEVIAAAKKKVPVRLELLGTVTPLASIAVRPRIDSEITQVHFTDGAVVKQGDLLFTLDSRAIEALIKQMEGALARDKAQLEGAERDMKRFTELVEKNATPINNLENARTQAGVFRGAVRASEALIENLKVQLSYCTIRAPISGRVSMAAVKAGNFARQADTMPLATIIQVSPIYVTFSVPQRNLPELRQAVSQETAAIDAVIPGDARRATGQVTMIENTVDAATGMVAVRATMPNKDELLWPGTLVTVQLTLREDDAVAVPTVAVQVSQQGSFVFVVKDGVASVVPVKVARVVGSESIIDSGLAGGETVVTDGQLLLTNGTHVSTRQKAGA